MRYALTFVFTLQPGIKPLRTTQYDFAQSVPFARWDRGFLATIMRARGPFQIETVLTKTSIKDDSLVDCMCKERGMGQYCRYSPLQFA